MNSPRPFAIPPDAEALSDPARPDADSSIVPSGSIAGRALVAVIAIMTFLASLTLGAVLLVDTAANEWQSAVSREVTIQIRPTQGRDMDAEVAKAAEIARGIPGISEVQVYSKEEAARLLEPWLGAGLAFDDLPIPRLIIVRIAAGAAPDLDLLRKRLAEQVAASSLDDHRGWIAQMRRMARTAVAIGLVVLGLVFAATVLLVAFATRGAMATNRPIVEVLHFVGARERFIAREFQRHFLWLGLKGGILGGGLAVGTFALAAFLNDWYRGTPGQDQVSALFGTFAIGTTGYAAVACQVILVAGITALTSRLTVHRTMRAID